MKKHIGNILYFITHPIMLQIYFAVALMLTRNFQFLPASTMLNVAKSLFLSVIAMPLFIYFTTKYIRGIMPEGYGDMMMLAAFAAYFAILSFGAGTPFIPISIMQQLPLILLIVAMILEARKKLQMHTLCLSCLATTLIFTSLLLETNLLSILIFTILAIGGNAFFMLENKKNTSKQLAINFLLGTTVPIIFFLFILR
ncbi:MAG: hypothetical protein IJP95_04970 [Bacteroidales bacterium]|nr:hypothetical protein [Bacteroidales bacterium]